MIGQSPVFAGLTETRLDTQVTLRSGRPVLVVPDGHPVASTFERVILGWNGSREATRAISDAIPILKQAKFVEVLTISAHSVEPSAPPANIRICDYLLGNGIKAIGKTLPDSTVHGVGGLILARAAEQMADLIVMGALGRSRLRETMLGGVTDEVMAKTKIPLLMSH